MEIILVATNPHVAYTWKEKHLVLGIAVPFYLLTPYIVYICFSIYVHTQYINNETNVGATDVLLNGIANLL